jgi:hypothetical protein
MECCYLSSREYLQYCFSAIGILFNATGAEQFVAASGHRALA